MATGKESSNPFMAGVNTPRSDEDRLKLMKLMVFLLQKGICDKIGITVAHLSSYYCQANVSAVWLLCDVTRLQALVDKKKIVISEAVICEILQLNDAEGVVCLPNEEIFAGLAQIGYEKPGETPLFEGMLAVGQPVKEELVDEQVQKLEIVQLKARVKKLEKANKLKSSKLRRLRKVGASRRVEYSDDMEDVFNQGRMIADMDMNEGIELVKNAKDAESEGRHAKKQAEIYNLDLDHSSKVLSMQEDDSEVQEVVKVVTTAKLITEVTAAASQVSAASITIPAASATIPAASATIPAAKPTIPAAVPTVGAAYIRRRKGVIIKDPEEELSLKTPAETPKVKDKGKGIMVETPKPIKKKDQIEMDAEYAKKLQDEIDRDHDEFSKDIDWDAAMDHNTAGYKMDFFKGMTYAQICPIFQARFDENIRFLFKSREEMEAEDQEIIKSINETPAQMAAKRRKLTTPLASKVPVMDYQIVLIDNKPRFKIIRADETHQFYISFATLLKNFDREDLETLWRIVKDRFSTPKPTNFSDEYLLLTLRTMFEELHRQDAIWRNQKSVHGLALVKRWKLLASCGVHVITLSTI
uniref:Uncharacterized protein n=1 Tax=Tanacetum cinerariifolium TaxID=118510 RepID=A0A6L2NEF6_TANCI|nr:hypothetical protein [Tanacetum cinerariifolium]